MGNRNHRIPQKMTRQSRLPSYMKLLLAVTAVQLQPVLARVDELLHFKANVEIVDRDGVQRAHSAGSTVVIFNGTTALYNQEAYTALTKGYITTDARKNFGKLAAASTKGNDPTQINISKIQSVTLTGKTVVIRAVDSRFGKSSKISLSTSWTTVKDQTEHRFHFGQHLCLKHIAEESNMIARQTGNQYQPSRLEQHYGRVIQQLHRSDGNECESCRHSASRFWIALRHWVSRCKSDATLDYETPDELSKDRFRLEDEARNDRLTPFCINPKCQYRNDTVSSITKNEQCPTCLQRTITTIEEIESTKSHENRTAKEKDALIQWENTFLRERTQRRRSRQKRKKDRQAQLEKGIFHTMDGHSEA